MMKFLVLAFLASAAAFSAPTSVARPVRSAVTMSAKKMALAPAFAAALPIALSAQPANAFLGLPADINGIPIGVFFVFAPVLVAASVALIVIGPGAIQQAGRVFTGQSSKYMKGDY